MPGTAVVPSREMPFLETLIFRQPVATPFTASREEMAFSAQIAGSHDA
jgi:hypothetical protein